MRQLNRFAPPRVSAVVVVVLLLALTIALLNGVVARFAMSTINKTFSAVNDETDPEFPAPTSTLRSGGPQSLDSWESLGHQGRVFVSAGPTVEELTKFNGKPAIEPIRAYAGLHSAPGIKATAQLAADELRRTGGLDRAVVAVATTTGTGWINEAEASALEYMYNGNTAIVSMQYSFLPSWLSFLVDKENARQAGQALFEAVDAMIKERPEGKRPKLVVFGESLGSFGGEAPFLALNNLVARTDGALFSGPTFNNTIWEDLTRNRDKGSPMWLPIYDKGENVRFAARADNLGRPPDPWGKPRVVYLQHASDPIAWWNVDLLFAKPDWLREPRGYDVSPRMEWIPMVTFLQVSADMAVAVDVPDGHGHVYVKDVANAWAAILQPPGWTPEKTEKLRPLLSNNENARPQRHQFCTVGRMVISPISTSWGCSMAKAMARGDGLRRECRIRPYCGGSARGRRRRRSSCRVRCGQSRVRPSLSARTPSVDSCRSPSSRVRTAFLVAGVNTPWSARSSGPAVDTVVTKWPVALARERPAVPRRCRGAPRGG